MDMLQTRYTRQAYLTIWWIGCITFLTSVLISLAFHYTVVPLIERLEMMKLPAPVGILLFVPLSLQVCFCFLFLAGFGAILGLCRWRHAPFRLFLLGSLPILGVFLLYAIPQGLGDLPWGGLSWVSIYWADHILLLTSPILLVTSYFFFVLSTIVLLQKLWVQWQVPG